MIDHRDASFRDLLEDLSKTNPDRVMCYYDEEPFTWSDINSGADLLAIELADCGVRKGTHAGIYGINSANWIICFFAIQKLGAMGVLMNPALLPEDVAAHIKIAGITHLCCGESGVFGSGGREGFIGSVRQSAGCQDVKFINIGNDRDFRKIADEEKVYDVKALSVRPEPDDPALILFTSGSTGRPKCAMLSAYNVLIASYEFCEAQRLTEKDRACLIVPLFHMFGLVAGLVTNALAGAAVYMPRDIHADTLIDTIWKHKCTTFHAVPTMMLMMLESKHFEPEKLSTLRCTILAGAAATGEQIKKFQKALPWNHFLSSYGLSEAAPISTLPYGDTLENCIKTVGKPMRHIKLRIQDFETGRECKVGESGEVVVRGDNLMTGYYRAKIEDQPIDEDGWLHTGDLGFIREDGYLCLSGRLKELIIKGGENIMPQEVADAVNTLPGIEDVRVVGVPSEFYGEEVCACIRLKDGAEFDEARAKSALKGSLARFKIPSYFLIYDKFPVLGTGKVDMVTLRKDAEKRCGEK